MNKIKILHVEDSEDDAFIIKEMLHRTSPNAFEISWAKNRTEALTHLLQNKFDVLLLDEKLVHESGLDLAEELVKRRIRIPIIFLTSFDTEYLDAKSEELGISDLLNKATVDAKTLTRSIRYAVSRFEHESQRIEETLIDLDLNIVAEKVFIHDLDLSIKRHNYIKADLLLVCFSLKKFVNLVTTLSDKDLTKILFEIAQKIAELIKPYDYIGRLAENRFAFVINDFTCSPSAEQKILSILKNSTNLAFQVSFNASGILLKSNVMENSYQLLDFGLSVLRPLELVKNPSDETTLDFQELSMPPY